MVLIDVVNLFTASLRFVFVAYFCSADVSVAHVATRVGDFSASCFLAPEYYFGLD